jgi:hypothetical protein
MVIRCGNETLPPAQHYRSRPGVGAPMWPVALFEVCHIGAEMLKFRCTQVAAGDH